MIVALSATIRKRVIAEQDGRCANGPECERASQDGQGADLVALANNEMMHKYLPANRKAVEIDHIKPRAAGGGDERGNLQALCGWCHDKKTTGERADWKGPAPSVFSQGIFKSGKTMGRQANKTARLVYNRPVKSYRMI